MNVIYVEKEIKEHPKTKAIIRRFNKATIIECEYYSEIFNVKAQNFKIQKENPCLILAKKNNNLILPTPEGFGIGGEQNYYFSHMLNCIYDCRYCFLQGMYHSANFVLFVNFKAFQEAIEKKIHDVGREAYFFSGYDCDSLAYESVTEFIREFLPFFREQKKAILELRTKSTNIKELLKQEVISNCVVAFSFTPEKISMEIEHKVPSVKKRIAAMKTLAEKGWKIGLRLDPLIYKSDYQQQYHELIKAIFSAVSYKQIHSVSVGPMRFPVKMFQKIVKLYPMEKLLAQPLVRRNNNMTYQENKEQEIKNFVLKELGKYMNKTLIFECNAF